MVYETDLVEIYYSMREHLTTARGGSASEPIMSHSYAGYYVSIIIKDHKYLCVFSELDPSSISPRLRV